MRSALPFSFFLCFADRGNARLSESTDDMGQFRIHVSTVTKPPKPRLFLGWRRMCELSAAGGSCQDDEGFQPPGGIMIQGP